MNRVINYPFAGIEVVITNGDAVASAPDLIFGDRYLTFRVCEKISNDASYGINVAEPGYIKRIFLYIKARVFSSEKVLKNTK